MQEQGIQIPEETLFISALHDITTDEVRLLKDSQEWPEALAGDLRAGLPLQSVHDGEIYQHEPLRLNVFIEAPVDEMSKIVSRHQSVRQLVDNEWIFLFAINEDRKATYRYSGDLQWEVI